MSYKCTTNCATNAQQRVQQLP